MTEFIDYTISDKGITLTITKNSTLYKWSSISLIESDSNYYYFTCKERCSIISKYEMNSETQNSFETLMQEKGVPFEALH